MRFILLTGAGFSRNWGGWLADEIFEYLLGVSNLGEELRKRLWVAKEKKQGFEDVLARVQLEYELSPGVRDLPLADRNYRALSNAVMVMFAEMAAGYEHVYFFDGVNNQYMPGFLAKFDAIYTLNQDTLIEQKYATRPFSFESRFKMCTLPGLKPAPNIGFAANGRKTTEFWTSDHPANFTIAPDHQPYIKLHGSFNWMQASQSILILGGDKQINIKKYPLLAWYHHRFKEDLSSAGTRLMIIGYSFNDPHINDAMTDAIGISDLKIFIIDPLGVDVFDKRDSRAQIRQPIAPLMEKLSARVIGASRRPLLHTFKDDVVEHAKIMKFFA